MLERDVLCAAVAAAVLVCVLTSSAPSTSLRPFAIGTGGHNAGGLSARASGKVTGVPDGATSTLGKKVVCAGDDGQLECKSHDDILEPVNKRIDALVKEIDRLNARLKTQIADLKKLKRVFAHNLTPVLVWKNHRFEGHPHDVRPGCHPTENAIKQFQAWGRGIECMYTGSYKVECFDQEQYRGNKKVYNPQTFVAKDQMVSDRMKDNVRSMKVLKVSGL